ncbi:hypothetical protein KBD20_04620 [Candidatus Saccharibacteria bacterium]|nr:hypothetical protein [Candidatus Saccharibacteria bacterium]
MSNEKSVYIHGETGNIGSAFHKVIDTSSRYVHVDTANNADIIGLCVPSHIGATLLNQVLKDQLVIDFSGAAKQTQIGNYGLINSAGELWLPVAQELNIYGNPGCMAAAVLIGLEQSGVLGYTKNSLTITAVGGEKYSPSGSTGELWVARRTHEHPHVAEIEHALESYDISIASFVPIISRRTKSGLLVTVSGELSDTYTKSDSSKSAVDVKSVVGSDKLVSRLEVYTDSSDIKRFMLHMAIDNIHFVVANALKLMDIITK